DPLALLLGLHVWPWRTQELLDFVGWMRGYNVDHPTDPLSFVGIDAVHPQVTMDTVQAFLRTYDGDWAAAAADRYDCLRTSAATYNTVPHAEQDACKTKVADVFEHMVSEAPRLISATSASEVDFFLRAARVVMQTEDVLAGRNPPPPG